jgi:hypothetical protein
MSIAVAALLSALALGGDAVTYDKPCVDRFLVAVDALEHGDTKPVVEKKLEALGKPRTVTKFTVAEYGINGDDQGIYWMCMGGRQRSEGFEPGKLVVWFRQGDAGQLVGYAVIASHRRPPGETGEVFDVLAVWVRGRWEVWEVPKDSRPWNQPHAK